MKTRADLEALKRELKQRINLLNKDTVFLNMPEGQGRIQLLVRRLEAVELLADNLTLLDWIFNDNTDVKRADLVDQDKV